MKKHIKHLRHHAKNHIAAHQRLKHLLGRNIYKEKIWDLFIATFIVSIITMVVFLNWGRVTTFFVDQMRPAEENQVEQASTISIHGFKTGLLSTYQINGQTADQYIRYLRQIPGGGYQKGLNVTQSIGKKQEEINEKREDIFFDSIFLSTDLSKGSHLTQSKSKSLQKSLLATFYLGEKTVNINSTLGTDTQLLAKIKNALAVDIFQFLNQSNDRAETIDNYLNLLRIMQKKALERSQDLSSVMAFLSDNFNDREQSTRLSEETFFENLSIFDGENAEEELGKFIGLQQGQSEIKAKIGAYQMLKNYYDFFLPQLDNLIRAIEANRDPLIAGVKVVEIQNMTLPLIIRER